MKSSRRLFGQSTTNQRTHAFTSFSFVVHARITYPFAMRQVRSGPSPEEFQRQLADFMRKHFPGVTNPAFATDTGDDVGHSGANGGDDFQFTYKPRDVKSHLDRFVIKQDDAKKVLSVALCDHYNHVRLARE